MMEYLNVVAIIVAGLMVGSEWEDIDFGEQKLTPRRSIVKQHVGAVKTEKSKNSIPLDDDLLDELLAWRQETPYAENSDYIFASPKMKGKQPVLDESHHAAPHQTCGKRG